MIWWVCSKQSKLVMAKDFIAHLRQLPKLEVGGG
jgi:hypothetical protein